MTKGQLGLVGKPVLKSLPVLMATFTHITEAFTFIISSTDTSTTYLMWPKFIGTSAIFTTILSFLLQGSVNSLKLTSKWNKMNQKS